MAPYSLLITRQTNRVSLSIENSKMNCKYLHGSSFAPYCSTLSFQLRVTLTKCWLGRWFHQRELLGIDGAGSWDPNLCHLQMELSASRDEHSLSLLIFTQRWWWLDVGGCVFGIPVLMWTDSFFIYQYMFYNLWPDMCRSQNHFPFFSVSVAWSCPGQKWRGRSASRE